MLAFQIIQLLFMHLLTNGHPPNLLYLYCKVYAHIPTSRKFHNLARNDREALASTKADDIAVIKHVLSSPTPLTLNSPSLNSARHAMEKCGHGVERQKSY